MNRLAKGNYPSKLKVIVVDDHPLFVNAMKENLLRLPYVKKVITASKGEDLLRILKKDSDFHLVFLDIEMPGMGGIEALRELRLISTRIRVIALSTHDQASHVMSMYKNDVNGYILKSNTTFEYLQHSIEELWKHDSFFPPGIKELIFDSIHAKKKNPAAKENGLNEREKHITTLLTEGYTNTEIATKLCLSESTIKFYRKSIYKKTECNSIAALTIYAMKNNLIS